MNINRRSFLKGCLTVAATSIIPAAALAKLDHYPTIWGDLTHDDTAGLQAALDGTPFYADGVLIAAGADPIINGGIFLLTDTLRITRDCTVIRDSRFMFSKEVKTCLEFRSVHDGLIANCQIGFIRGP